jgi:hypothetical protein
MFQEMFKSGCISHLPENIGDCMSVPGNFPQQGDGEKFLERFKCLDPTYTAEFELIPQSSNLTVLDPVIKTPPPCNRKKCKEGSGKRPSRGRWRNVPGKVQISMHLTYP